MTSLVEEPTRKHTLPCSRAWIRKRMIPQHLGQSASPTPTATITSSRHSPNSVEKFNPFHDALGRFANKMGFKTYSANPKMRAAQPSIIRSARAGHGRTANVHRESKGENVGQNYAWMRGQPIPGRPANSQTSAPTRNRQQTQKPAQKPTQNPPAQQKPAAQAKPGTVAAGKAQNAVDGKDLAGKFRFNDNSTDYSIEQVIKAQGFDGKPTLTSDKAAFASACKASNFIAKRGVGATDQRTLDAYDQALKTGDFYVKCSGGSVHGYGMYAASVAANGRNAKFGIRDAEGTAQAYAAGSRAQKIYTMTLDKSAKIGDEYTLKQQMRRDTEFQNVCNASKMNSWYTQDVGVYAAYKGYDAYIANSGRSSTSGSSSDYTVILNRSKVIIYDQTV